MEAALGDLSVLVSMLACLPLEESLQIAAPLGRLWHFAALQPGALVGLLRLRGFYEVAPMGLTKLLGRGCLRQVEMVEIEEPCCWCPEVLSSLPSLRQLRVSGARKGRPAVDVDLAASSILAVASQLTILEFRCQGFGSWPSVSVWPRTPALRRLSVREMPLSIWDLPNLFAAHDLETLELQACPLTESQMGIVHSGANVKPEVVILVGCGGKMALTVLLSLGLTRLCYLRVDSPTDAKLKARKNFLDHEG
ncbi:DNA polymerase alpha subunit B [Durusdinium trenchii]|uniref:DNA polymerase alpha subunit B n=1 Tax=Durusdinium trenchii TaxID=1381693 RepID=A0ABP0LST2_9DINO